MPNLLSDFCLVGIENVDAGNVDPAPCVGALKALADCVKSEAGADCPGAPIVDASWVPNAGCGPLMAAPLYSACQILHYCPVLTACSFLAYPPGLPDASTADASLAIPVDDAGG